MALMEFVRETVTESAGATFTETEIATPASKSELMAMLIHDIWFFQDMKESVDATFTAARVQLTRAPQTTWVYPEDPEWIAGLYQGQTCGETQGTLSEYQCLFQQLPNHWHFDPPLLYAKSKMYLGVHGLNTTVVIKASVLIGYTLERVSREDFIAALVE